MDSTGQRSELSGQLCKYCESALATETELVPESMFGTGEQFRYRTCLQCGALHLIDVPRDLDRYYPSSYYSFSAEPVELSGVHRWVRRARLKVLLAGWDALDRALFRRPLPPWLPWIAGRGVTTTSRICDVGCGSAQLLRSLSAAGFTDLTGADPYVPEDVAAPGLRLLRLPPQALDGGPYDVVILSHSLEHMLDPAEALRAVRRLVGRDGTVVLRVPLADSFARRTYGVHWVQLDAPRHLTVPTRDAVQRLAERASFEIDKVIDDSTAFQFWGSEQCRAGIPLCGQCVNAMGAQPLFSTAEIDRFDSRARDLNDAGEGDQATFLLRPT